jgi:hypothetical protein
MIEILEFVFSNPWRFIGTLMFLAVATNWTPISFRTGLGYNDILKLGKKANKIKDEE